MNGDPQSTDGGESNVEAFLAAFASDGLSAGPTGIRLDWTDAGLSRIDDVRCALLTNALLREPLGKEPVHVRVEDKHVDAAVLCGLPFALANRPGDTYIDPMPSRERLTASQWTRSWTPATRSAWIELLGPSPDSLETHDTGNGSGHAEGGPFGKHHAMFVNAHRAARTGGAEPVFRLLSPWLSRYIEGRPRLKDRLRWKGELLADVRTVVEELIQNVRAHATTRHGPAVDSLVKAILVSEQTGADRLTLLVQDTGLGIVETAKPKLREEDRNMPAETLLKSLVEGSVQPWGRGRGIGLPKVHEACKRWGGTLAIATGPVRLDYDGATDGAVRSACSSLAAAGTVASVVLPLMPY